VRITNTSWRSTNSTGGLDSNILIDSLEKYRRIGVVLVVHKNSPGCEGHIWCTPQNKERSQLPRYRPTVCERICYILFWADPGVFNPGQMLHAKTHRECSYNAHGQTFLLLADDLSLPGYEGPSITHNPMCQEETNPVWSTKRL